MVLVNVAVFTIIKILHNLAFMQKSFCLAKITKIAQCNLIFIFIEFLETAKNSCLVLGIKNLETFIKTHFYLNWGCIKMYKHEET